MVLIFLLNLFLIGVEALTSIKLPMPGTEPLTNEEFQKYINKLRKYIILNTRTRIG